MTSTEKLQPYFESYSQKIKQRRNELGMSSKALAAKSGVPYSNICRVDTGAQANPLLYNAAATADVLGLSLDELCGLTVPENNTDELKSRCRKLELENARLAATRAAQQEQIKAVHSLCYVLVFFCVLLALSLVSYLLIDSQVTDAGIIRGGKLSVAAWLFISMIAASVISIGIVILLIIRKERRNSPS